jgi:acetolactate synthase I/II/III large subunit
VRFHRAFASDLRDQEISVIFGLVGDGNLFLMDSFRGQPGARYVPVANEASAVAAAVGYWHVTGELGVASVTHGPALTNTITPLIEAVKGRVPVLLIAGDTAGADKDNFQNVAQRELVVAAGAGFEQVRTPQTAGADLAEAVRRAQVERRPVVLNVPADFQWQDVEHTRAARRPAAAQAVAADPAALDLATGIIATARRPVVLAGRGAISAGSRAALVRLARRTGAPLATTLMAVALFRDEPGDLGVFGTLSSPSAVETITDADCVLAFGASLNSWTTAEGSLLTGKSVVQVDIDPAALGRHALPHAGVVADAAAAARAMAGLLDEADIPPTTFAAERFAGRPAAAVGGGNGADAAGAFGIQQALRLADEVLPAERTVVHDCGRFVPTSFTALPVRHPRGFVHTVNYAAIGLGLPTAIGAAVGAPDRPTVAVCGDGGFVLGGLTEFMTAVRHRLDLTVLVLNDGSYGAEYVQLASREMDPSISLFDWPDFGPVATAMGGFGVTVRTAAGLRDALAATRRQHPALIDIKLDPAQVPWHGGHR